MRLTELLPHAGLSTLPPTTKILDTLHVVSLPMWLSFRGITTREVALLHGPAGWGEFGAFPEYDDAEAARWLACGIEMAWIGPPPAQRDSVRINGTIPALTVTENHDPISIQQREKLEHLIESFQDVSTIKIKVAEKGQTLTDDIARVTLVHRLHPTARIRIDANAGWTVTEALEAIPLLVLAAGGEELFDYVEQPCATLPELTTLRHQLPNTIRIAADESVRRSHDPLHVVRTGIVDHVVVKAAPLGGPRHVLHLAADIPQALTVSSALDSVIGINAGIATAAALPGDIADCGLGTGQFFTSDVGTPHHLHKGTMAVHMHTPDPLSLTQLAASSSRTHWWKERLRRCYRLLGGEDA